MQIFETPRLEFHTLSLVEYSEFELGNEPSWNGFTNPFKHLVEGPSPIGFLVSRVKNEPKIADIGLVLAVSKVKQEIVGSGGFKDFPDANGMIEIGYGIVPEMQNQGLGRELLTGLFKIISTNLDVKVLRYVANEANGPSLHIIRSLGFPQVGLQIDPEEGTELIFDQTIENFMKATGL
jgi:ribosomal-protein-alanine N-acetyltransferase